MSNLNFRIKKSGYKIISSPKVKFFYYPRESLIGLSKQYLNYGKARVKVIKKHKSFFRIKHLVPSILLINCILAIIFFDNFIIFKILIYLYIALIFLFSLVKSLHNFSLLTRIFLSFLAIHFSYGLGFIHQLIKFLLKI